MSGGSVGAELSTLKTLHTTFTRTSSEALDIKSSVDKGIHSAVWTGKFSNDFRNAWQEYRKNLDNLSHALTSAAQDVKTNATNIAHATGETPPI